MVKYRCIQGKIRTLKYAVKIDYGQKSKLVSM